MICSEGELRPSEIRPEVCTHYHSRQHLPVGCTISPLRQPQTTTGICDYHLPIILQLAQDTYHSKQTGVRVENRASAFGGKTQDRSAHEACLQGLECRMLRSVHTKGAPFRVRATRGSARSAKSLTNRR